MKTMIHVFFIVSNKFIENYWTWIKSKPWIMKKTHHKKSQNNSSHRKTHKRQHTTKKPQTMNHEHNTTNKRQLIPNRKTSSSTHPTHRSFRQVFNETLWPDAEYHCVRCADQACAVAIRGAIRWTARGCQWGGWFHGDWMVDLMVDSDNNNY